MGAAGYLLRKQIGRLKSAEKSTEGVSNGKAWREVLSGIAELREFMGRMEIAMAGIRPLRESVERHDQELRTLRLDSRSIRDELSDIRRENEDRDAKIIRLAREIREGD